LSFSGFTLLNDTLVFHLLTRRTGHIQSVHCVPDIISLNAFKGSKVTEAWGQRFTHWMPICESQ